MALKTVHYYVSHAHTWVDSLQKMHGPINVEEPVLSTLITFGSGHTKNRQKLAMFLAP